MELFKGKMRGTIALFAMACSFIAISEGHAQTGDMVPKTTTETVAEAQGKTSRSVYDDIVQRGEVLASAYGDVDGDGEEEKILLMGNRFSAGSNYYTKLYLLTRSMKTGNIEGAIRPTLGGGYNCSLRLADVTGNGVADILIVAPTGGSGGIIDYRIVDFTDNNPREIFTADDNQGIQISGEYLPDYKVRIVFGQKEQEIIMDVTADLGFYGYLGVYDEKGALLQDYHRPYGQYLSGLIMLDTDNDEVSELVTTQRIVGLNNTDTLGYVRAVWRYTVAGWQRDNYTFQSRWDSFDHKSERSSCIGLGGYIVNPEQAIDGRSQITYPRISNVGNGPQQWKANETIENFVRMELEEIRNQGYLEMDYEIKYCGYNLLSLLMTGKKEGRGGDEDILKAFNFDVRTGEVVPLGKLLGNDGKLWSKIAEITSKQGGKVTAATLKDYYFDGMNFVFIQNNEEKQRLEVITVPKNELMEFFKKNKIEKQN